MESISTFVTGTMLDPVTLGSAAALTAALVSGAAARVLEAVQDRGRRR